jgi:hypothetical protein
MYKLQRADDICLAFHPLIFRQFMYFSQYQCELDYKEQYACIAMFQAGFEPGSYDPEADAMSTAPRRQGNL